MQVSGHRDKSRIRFRFPLFIYLTCVSDISALPGQHNGVCQLRLARGKPLGKRQEKQDKLWKNTGNTPGKDF